MNAPQAIGATRPSAIVRLMLKSGNTKTGVMPVSMTATEGNIFGTCPDACSFKGKDPVTGKSNGCYAAGGRTRMAWNTVAKNGRGWSAFCQQVATEIKPGEVWRHNGSGDMPCEERDKLCAASASELATANTGRKGFTYTHYPTNRMALQRARKLDPSTPDHTRHNRDVIASAVLQGFTVNVSHDSLAELDAGVADVLPSVVVLPKLAPGEVEPRQVTTPGGRTVRVCPAQYAGETPDGKAKVTCTRCQWCADPTRKFAIGFRAHGFAKNAVSRIVERDVVEATRPAGKRELGVLQQ